jgi:hypothetical protein
MRLLVPSKQSEARPVNASPRDRDTICPSWCQLPADHIAESRFTDEMTHTQLVREISLAEIGTFRTAPDQPIRVQVEAFVDLDGCEYAATVKLSLCGAADDPDAGAEDLTPAEARELAAALVEAAQIAES